MSDERGAIMVITALILTVLIGVAAYALDTSIWFVHHRHLQTQADAAALAAAQAFQCTPGTANPTIDSKIASIVSQYNGSGQTAPPSSYVGPTPVNGQVWDSPTYSTTYSSAQHNLFSLLNSGNWKNQSEPNDSGMTGSPCQDGSIDVKMTETNLPSAIPFLNPQYVNAQARVSLEQLTSSGLNEPLAIPNAAASVVKAQLIDESNGTPLGGGLVTLTGNSDSTTWTGTTSSPLTFNNTITGPIGLRVQIGGGTTCGTQLSCYDSGSNNGIAYMRVWSNSGTPGVPASSPGAPQVGDANLVAAATSPCPSGPNGLFSNFISSASTCNVQLSVPNAVFTGTGGTALSCSTASLTLSVGGTNYTMNCPANGPNGAWTSQNVPISANNGPATFTLGWTLKAGNKPPNANGGTQGVCGDGVGHDPNPCTGSFGVVQRVFSGAFDTASSNSSRSGPIIGATVSDPNNSEVMSHQLDGTQEPLTITVSLINSGFQDATSVTTGNPTVLHTAGSQGTFAIQCGNNNGSSTFTLQMAAGCTTPFATTNQPNPPICNNQPPGPAVCVTQNPGTGKKVEDGVDCRINGTVTYTNGTPSQCSPTTSCVSHNYWTSQNSLSDIVTQTPADPRLVQILLVDSNAWVGVSGSSFQTPVRSIATFYITGWNGDPCLASANGTSGTSGGLSYIPDDDPTTYGFASSDHVLLGHFVHYTVPGSGGGGSGSCTASFGDCVAILTK